MAWDFKIDQKTGDLTKGYVAGQDEIIQRINTRLYRHLGEWFVNTSCGLPWYAGPSGIIPGELSQDAAILGTRSFRYADIWIRNEIANTDGVVKITDFNTFFDTNTRTYSVRAQIVTTYGLPYIFSMDRVLDARKFFEGIEK